MKEIKAYVRERQAGAVVEALVRAGFPGFSVLTVRGVADGLVSEAYEYSVELGEAYERVVKIELICGDAKVAVAVDVIHRAAHTGQRGDGMVFVAPIESALRIADGTTGAQALERS
ncbi:MAG: P-II family nitrogen regulator [Dehalococcoidia bacterium]|nr:P-II family nitrogen regulator [Myxococcales bacterium]MCB9492236.1 P-II family nitrogen regulator [Dehalococcoidia bacterium]MCB9507865.1 P-II family nitrogen regulator [Myxococcales bacterium]